MRSRTTCARTGAGFRVARSWTRGRRWSAAAVAGLVVEDVRDLEAVVEREARPRRCWRRPPTSPRRCATGWSTAGVTGILTFVPRVLQVPERRGRAVGGPGDRAADPRVPRSARKAGLPH